MAMVRAIGPWAAALALLAASSAGAALPHAVCRSTDPAEAGLSGQTTQAEIDSGKVTSAVKCNADLVGQYQGEGASWQLTAWKNCAYFDQRLLGQAGSTTMQHPGTVVVDVTDPTHPQFSTSLQEAAMLDPWESLKVNPARQLLAGAERSAAIATYPGDGFAVYDISADCKHPVLQSTVHLPGSYGHTGQWAPDGKTYYVTPLRFPPPYPSIIAVDVTDPTNPTVISGGEYAFNWQTAPIELPLPRLHDTEFSKDGNTAYITMFGNYSAVSPGDTSAKNGLGIIDVSDFQQRRTNPKYRVLGFVTWDDGSVGAQNALPITIAGKPYILMTDEGGNTGATSLASAVCTQGKSASGFPRLIDVSDPTKPVVTSKIQLDIHDAANCTAAISAPFNTSSAAAGNLLGTNGGNIGFFGNSCHYCNVDNADDAKIAACNCFASGLRIFDIHNPTAPKEMAYYKPPAQGTKALAGSQYANSNSTKDGTPFVRSFDWATSKVSFPKDRGATSGDIWTTSQDNGFQVIHLFSSVAVTPSTAALATAATTQLTATVSGAAATAGVTWSVDEGTTGGSVDATGKYVAPASAGTYHVTATSILDATAKASAVITATAKSGGCSTGEGSLIGLGVLVLLGFLSRRRSAV